MSKLLAIRIDEDLLAEIDRERRQVGLTRARAVKQALSLWMEQRRYQEAVRRDRQGYETHPVKEEEFGPVLGAQTWPR